MKVPDHAKVQDRKDYVQKG